MKLIHLDDKLTFGKYRGISIDDLLRGWEFPTIGFLQEYLAKCFTRPHFIGKTNNSKRDLFFITPHIHKDNKKSIISPKEIFTAANIYYNSSTLYLFKEKNLLSKNKEVSILNVFNFELLANNKILVYFQIYGDKSLFTGLEYFLEIITRSDSEKSRIFGPISEHHVNSFFLMPDYYPPFPDLSYIRWLYNECDGVNITPDIEDLGDFTAWHFSGFNFSNTENLSLEKFNKEKLDSLLNENLDSHLDDYPHLSLSYDEPYYVAMLDYQINHYSVYYPKGFLLDS